jgi:hypothetical protein
MTPASEKAGRTRKSIDTTITIRSVFLRIRPHGIFTL